MVCVLYSFKKAVFSCLDAKCGKFLTYWQFQIFALHASGTGRLMVENGPIYFAQIRSIYKEKLMQ